MQKQPVLWCFYVVEGPLVPNAPFIKQQRFALGVPVTGHMELARSIEIIFDQLGFGLRFVVPVKGMVILQRLSTVVKSPNVIRINEGLPLAIQVSGVTRTDIGDQRRKLCCASTAGQQETQDACQTAEQLGHE